VRHFALLDPDPDSITSVDPYPNLNSESASTELIESGSNPDLDPKHCPTLPLFLSLWPVISDLQGEAGGGACPTQSQLHAGVLLVGILVAAPPFVVLEP
jgi:hypothetical protein